MHAPRDGRGRCNTPPFAQPHRQIGPARLTELIIFHRFVHFSSCNLWKVALLFQNEERTEVQVRAKLRAISFSFLRKSWGSGTRFCWPSRTVLHHLGRTRDATPEESSAAEQPTGCDVARSGSGSSQPRVMRLSFCESQGEPFQESTAFPRFLNSPRRTLLRSVTTGFQRKVRWQ